MLKYIKERAKIISVLLFIGAAVLSLSGCESAVRKASTSHTLSIEVEGEGTVSPADAASFADGTMVDVKAEPAADANFSRWEGEVAEPTRAETTVLMDKNKVVTAYFTEEVYLDSSEAVMIKKFAAGSEKEIDLGVLADGESLVVALSPLNLDPTSFDIYDAALDVTFADGSVSGQVSISSDTSTQEAAPPQAELDAELRRREDDYLAQDLSPAQAGETVRAAADYSLGEKRSFYNKDDVSIDSTLKAIGNQVLIYVDDRIKDKIEPGSLEEMAAAFDDNIYPRVMDKFAFHNLSEYDWDDDGKTVILIYDMDNYAGYFYGRDFYSKDIFATSNEADMFYLNYELIARAEDPHYLTTMDDVLATVAHEFQHLAFFINKYHSGRRLSDIWINEGFSMLAEYLTGYLDYNEDSFVSEYFKDTSATSLMGWEQEVSNYGVNALFALYLYERLGAGIIEEIQTADVCASEVITAGYADFSEIFLGGMISNYIDHLGLEPYSYAAVDLAHQPDITTIDGSISRDISIKSTAVKYFEIKGNGSRVNLKVDGLLEDTGIVIYQEGIE